MVNFRIQCTARDVTAIFNGYTIQPDIYIYLVINYNHLGIYSVRQKCTIYCSTEYTLYNVRGGSVNVRYTSETVHRGIYCVVDELIQYTHGRWKSF